MIGTGAVDAFESDRAVSVDVVGGGEAFVGIDPSGSEFVTENSPIQIDLNSASGHGGSGVPNNATTEIRPAFTLANQASETLYIEADNPLADSDLSDGGVDVQFLAVNDPDDFVIDDNEPVLFDRTNPVRFTGQNDPGSPNPARIPQTAGSGVLRDFVGATNDSPPQYLELAAGEDVSVIVRVVAKDAEPPVSLTGSVGIEAFDERGPTTLPGGADLG